MQDNEATNHFKDGFWEDDDSIDEDYVIYKNQSGLKVLYLHGGLHLFDAGSQIIKKTYSKTHVDLITQIKENLDNSIYPIFVSEWDKKQKMTKIMHSAYLNSCYKSLKSIWKDLVIYGTNLKSNDEHILDAIMSSKVKNLYIWTSDPKNIAHIQIRVDEYNEWKAPNKKLNLHLFNSRSVNPWEYASK